MLNKHIILSSLYVLITTVSATTVTSVYPPFAKGERYLVSQGFFGQFTHDAATNIYAIDINMPQGSLICAARAGNVYQLRKEQKKAEDALFVRIQHDDGTIADYHHLQAGSFNVDVEQRIENNQCFARVGNTGITTGAHLHFAILQEQEDKLISIPFQFRGEKGDYWPEYLRWVAW